MKKIAYSFYTTTQDDSYNVIQLFEAFYYRYLAIYQVQQLIVSLLGLIILL